MAHAVTPTDPSVPTPHNKHEQEHAHVPVTLASYDGGDRWGFAGVPDERPPIPRCRYRLRWRWCWMRIVTFVTVGALHAVLPTWVPLSVGASSKMLERLRGTFSWLADTSGYERC